MTETTDPWRDIDPPKEDRALNVRRADAGHPLNYWFARDFQDRYVFYFDAETSPPPIDALPRLAGIEVIAFEIGEENCRLVLTLLDTEQFDVFRTLCADLMKATAHLRKEQSLAGLTITLTRLRRWQGLLEKAQRNILSQSRIIGLIGELFVLRDFLFPALSVHDAVQSWRGPYGDEQDFLLAGRIIEVKTQLSTADRNLNVSSEDQLDTGSGPIMICHQTLDVPASDQGEAFSLNGLIASMAETIASTDIAAADLFRSGLLEAGYRKREEYDRPFWLLNARTYLEVRDGFPRIVPSMLEPGIGNVRYRVAVQACAEFKIDEDLAKEWAFSG
jgi:hypothetical protein